MYYLHTHTDTHTLTYINNVYAHKISDCEGASDHEQTHGRSECQQKL